MQNKAVCRMQLKNYVLSLNSRQQTLDEKISKNVIDLISQLFASGAQQGGSYRSLKDEPTLELPTSWSLSYPKVINSTEMQFYLSPENNFESSSLNVLEPLAKAENLIKKNDHDFILVPGLGFSAQGCRLGRGQGYYDRYLSEFKNIKIGVGYCSENVGAFWAPDLHDIPMDYVVTDQYIMKVM